MSDTNHKATVTTTASKGASAYSAKTASHARAVGTFVPRLTRKAIEKYGFSAAALLTDWAAIVGTDLAAYTEPKRLKWPRAVEAYAETEVAGRPGATLELRVDGARALDVQYKGRQIIERINAYFGYRAVAELRIIQAAFETVGTRAAAARTTMPGRPAAPTPRQAIGATLGKHSAARPAADLAAVTDTGLRDALERLQRNLASR